MSEYLRGFRTDRIKGVDYHHMLSSGHIISPRVLAEELTDALSFLTTTPGPHLFERVQHAAGWLPWWISYLKTLPSTNDILIPSPKLIALDSLGSHIDPEKRSGVLFVAGAEGHEGHRFAASWIKQHVSQSVWMFEEEEYLHKKTRQGSYLSLEERISMWCHHPDVDFISVTPLWRPEIHPDINAYYQAIFDATKAQYCFASEDDPNLEEKQSRGKRALFTRIPTLPVASTTKRVERLFPSLVEDHEEDALAILADLLFPYDVYEKFRSFDQKFD